MFPPAVTCAESSTEKIRSVLSCAASAVGDACFRCFPSRVRLQPCDDQQIEHSEDYAREQN